MSPAESPPSPPSSRDGKDAWRAWARPIFGTPAPSATTAGIVEHIRTLLDRPRCTVVVYSSMPTEIDIGAVVGTGGHRYAITRTPRRGWLTLHPVDVAHETHRYGFRQPVADAPTIDDADVDVALVPGLVFDRAGYRLGHGGGYYDQLFSRLGNVVRIGVARADLLVDALPRELHDIPMTHIVTERGGWPIDG